jgi:uncharacterized membrane protein
MSGVRAAFTFAALYVLVLFGLQLVAGARSSPSGRAERASQ